MHAALIAAHATAGVVSLVAGVAAVRASGWVTAHLAAMLAMQVSLVAAVAVQWGQTPGPARAVFSALALLGAVMCARAALAHRGRPGAEGPTASYLGHLRFTTISLTDAFVVVAVLNAGAPLWAVVASGVGVAVVGHLAVTATGRRLLA